MQETYKLFAEFMLGDLCTRVRARRSRTPVRHKVFAGNFSRRTMDLNCKLRGSDCSMRIAHAMEAYIQAGEKQIGAAFLVHERLRQIEQATLERASKDTRVKPLSFPIGRTNRGNRSQRPARNTSDENPFSEPETIRVTALDYKGSRPNFDREFKALFGGFCMDFARTPEWLETQEPVYRRRLQSAEDELREVKGSEPQPSDYDFFAISLTGVLAELLHELGKFGEALPYYELAIKRLEAATIPMLPGYRENTLEQLTSEMADCLGKRSLKQGLGQVPGIVAPHLL